MFHQSQTNPAPRNRPILWRVLLGLSSALILPASGESHWNLQSVTPSGLSAWDGEFPVILRGILLNAPEDMLDPTPRFVPWDDGAGQYQLGGEWQIVVQAADPEDWGGTTCWLGQNYGNLPWMRDSELSYPNEAWQAEVDRLNHDPATGYRFREGDLVEITAHRSLFYGGKRNINEAHDIDPSADFEVSLVSSQYGLPDPIVVDLSEVMDLDDGNPDTREDRFDVTRATGGEQYQGMRVRMNGLLLTNAYYGTAGWDPAASWTARRCTVTDGQGRFFTLRVPRYSLGPPPTNRFDVIGIFTQESGSGTDGTYGYELFVTQIVPSLPPSPVIRPGITLSWPRWLAGYELACTDTLPSTNWTLVTNTPAVVGDAQEITIEPEVPHRFYRLRRVVETSAAPSP